MPYLASAAVTDIEIRFVSNLKAKNPIAEDLLTSLYNVQTPVDGIIPRDTLITRVSTDADQNRGFKLEPTEEPVDVDQ